MLGLFGTLNLANRSLQTQRQGTEVAGHNLANVNNTAYARQRVAISTSLTVPGPLGPQGTGADAIGIQRLRNQLTDLQIQRETSVRGSLSAQQETLQFMQASLGQEIDRQATGSEGAAAASGIGGQHGLAENLSDFFNAWQSLSTNPTSLTERQVLIMKTQNLTDQFNSVDNRLAELRDSTDEKLKSNVENANIVVDNIAKLNEQIVTLEIGGSGSANDLRDKRQEQIEKLSEFVKIKTIEDETGAVTVSVDGTPLVAGPNAVDKFETYDAGGGQMLVRTVSGTDLTLTGGSMHGLISVRDNELSDLRQDLDGFATLLIEKVNTLHEAGFGLDGSTGQTFFSGTGAADIEVNSLLIDDPSLVQASGTSGANADNSVSLTIAQLETTRHPELSNQTFSENYAQRVAQMGQSLSSVNTQINDQAVVGEMLLRQRDSVSGVSIDEEMTDLIKFQRAFEASAKMIQTVDEMLNTLMSLKR